MKCFNHPDREAFGICVTCGRGLCEDCSVVFNEKLYCKDDIKKLAASIVSRPTNTKSNRNVLITASSIIYYIIGSSSLGISVLLLLSFYLESRIPFIGNVLTVFTLPILLVSLMISVIGFLSADLLWKSSLKGGLLGIVTSIIVVTVTSPSLYIPIISIFYVGVMLINLIAIILIVQGWQYLS